MARHMTDSTFLPKPPLWAGIFPAVLRHRTRSLEEWLAWGAFAVGIALLKTPAFTAH